jgi:hypothetical protein
MRWRFLFLFLYLAPAGSTGAQDTAQLKIGGGTIDIEFTSPPDPPLRKMILDWTAIAARSVSTYYEKYPVPHVDIEVDVHDGRGIDSGRAFGWEHAHIQIAVGRSTSAADFSDDWTITHEMVHLAFPSVPRSHHWIEEGLATYVEPIARARAGNLTAEKIWGDMVESMPKGLPQAGDRGLDFTHTWGRTYWGGALFCLLADVEIRKRTGNRMGLEDGLRGILKSGGSIEVEWPLVRALQTADHAIGVSVLEEMYDKMRATPVAPDLDQLWKDLGIKYDGEKVTFDDSAPLAAVRKSIGERRGEVTEGDSPQRLRDTEARRGQIKRQ